MRAPRLREAIRPRREIGSTHVLLGLLRESSGLGVRVIAHGGVDLAALRTAALGRLPQLA